jgi:hypothetical protein
VEHQTRRRGKKATDLEKQKGVIAVFGGTISGGLYLVQLTFSLKTSEGLLFDGTSYGGPVL